MEVEWLTTAEAAERLGIGEERVRQLCRKGLLGATRLEGVREWRLNAQAVADHGGSVARRRPRHNGAAGRPSLDEIASDLATLLARADQADVALRAVERERDRYRADAAVVREAAMRLNRAATEAQAGVAALVAVMIEQAEALAALLGPGSVNDLMPDD